MPTAAHTRKLLDRLERNAATCKRLYAQQDADEAELIAIIQANPTGQAPIGVADAVALKDAFVDRNGATRNVAFKTTAIRRWSFERVARVNPPRPRKRKAKAAETAGVSAPATT